LGVILKRLLVIDNYDSFTYNLVQMFMCYDLTIDVYRSDFLSIEDVKILRPDYILISPGPKDPTHAGISTQLVKEFYQEIPILGVCLGMQCINEAFGGKTIRSPVPMHGKTSIIQHNGDFIFNDIPFQFKAARYHSLMVSVENSALKVTSQSEDGVIMGLSHRDYPLHGVQFHPESFLTEYGFKLIKNFLKLGPLS
jgi:anthranilate synthase component 2